MNDPAYQSDSEDCPELLALDKLRGLLATDPLIEGRFQGTIRQFPLTTALAGDDPAVSLYSPIEGSLTAATMGGSGVGRAETVYNCALEIAFYCEDGADQDVLDAMYRRLKNAQYRFRRALFKYRQDPSPQPLPVGSLWWKLAFLQPTTVIKKTGTLLFSVTRFTLSAHERMP